MPAITFDQFDAGLDVRKGASVSDANRMRVMDNCYVTTGKTIRKRPGLALAASIEAGTKGLRAGIGVLNTFYATSGVVHADPLFVAHRVTHPTLPAQEIAKIHFADSFNGFLYVVAEYANGDIRHHYLDDPGAWAPTDAVLLGDFVRPASENGFRYEATAITDPGAWAPATAYLVGDFRRPVTANGYRYEVTAIAGTGTSGAAEPIWPTTIGATVIDNAGADQITWTCRALVDAAEPIWPTTIGDTIADGEVTWACRSFAITDPNCPHTAAVVKKASKIFATRGDVVRFCATNDPRDWSSPSDAGFLGVGVQQSGTTTPTALGEYAGNLVVFFRDSAQVWAVDPDPALMRFIQGVDVGCPYPYGAANMAGDVFFASFDGVRSITTQTTTGNLIDVDVGSAIDAIVKPVFTTSASLRAFYFRGGGQFWVMVGRAAFVYSFSRTSKISAWSRYTFPFDIDDVTELAGDLYMRAGNNVYRLDDAIHSDAGDAIPVVVEFPFLDFKAPGVLKQIHGMDAVMVGSAQVAHRFDARDPGMIADGIAFSGDSRPGEVTPVEVCSAGIAPVVTHSADEGWELHALTYYFDSLTMSA